ncbi:MULTISPECIES: cyclic nucleotide-binding domain-containing protein [Agrobacterium]|uniref:cyclic nucleotide-binding domain-containing protein n=1 Tax=Agrobacterium TaxID=357 RepID=UPI000972604F|nr:MULTISPECIES: cyclic nucleotide-binding domain-containing protein [Agrobacterium]MBN7806221.1 cyclic nucleotide-binding domain-containing protein [Agrobacterium rosae]MDX8314706.1 cyclic nucleotide-binding domain-containing protein [Agrobacterium rosae]SCX10428.1 putative signal-transduction protein containing cAMP-binding and CBS domains [Agrobacterium sp. DSM 25558]
MALNDDIQLLAQVPLFQGLSDDQLRLIAFGAERRKIAQGQALFREHSPSECAFVIARGGFHLYSTGRSGKAELQATPTAGTMLSELALFTLCERKYTAVASEDSEVIRITRILFHRMIEEFPNVADVVMTRIRDNIAALSAGATALQGRFS